MPGFFPMTLEKLLQPVFLKEMVTNDHYPLRLVLRKNETYDWVPVAPVRFYFGNLDTTVDPQNAKFAFDHMKNLGARVSLVSLGDVEHQASALLGFVSADQWFASMMEE